jgi:hypothetical protein
MPRIQKMIAAYAPAIAKARWTSDKQEHARLIVVRDCLSAVYDEDLAAIQRDADALAAANELKEAA